MGGVSEMKDKHLSKADGKCAKLLYVSEVQVCRELEKECSESVDNAMTMPDATEKLMSLKRTFCPFSEAASNGTFVSRAPCNLFGECVREKLSYSGCLGSTGSGDEWKWGMSHGLMQFRETANAVCEQSLDAPEPCRNHCEDRFRFNHGLDGDAPLTCDYYRDYVFGTPGNPPKCDTGTPGHPPVGGGSIDNGSYGGGMGGSYGG